MPLPCPGVLFAGVGAAFVFGDLGATIANTGIFDGLGAAVGGIGDALTGMGDAGACCGDCGGCDGCGDCGDCGDCGECDGIESVCDGLGSACVIS